MPNAKTDKELFESVRILIERGQPWTVIAAAVGKSRKTLENWKNPQSKLFKKEFAQMLAEAEEALADKTKAGQFEQSVKHTLKKTLWEYREIDSRSLDKKDRRYKKGKKELLPAPEMPPTWFPKQYLVDYADQVLDLELDPRATAAEMRAECLLRVKELTVTVRVRIEAEQEVDPSATAVKNVLTNTGDEKNRWSFKEEHEIDASDPLKKLLEEIGGIKKGLPAESEIPDFEN
jgi:hypothetical protein